MPIDKAMTEELADAWFPPFLDAMAMSPTHPMRDAVFAEAELAVYDSYLDACDQNLSDAEFKVQQDAYQDIAADVIEVLRGVAYWVTNHTIGDRA